MPFESSLLRDAEDLAMSCQESGHFLSAIMIRTLVETVRDRDRKLAEVRNELKRYKAPVRKKGKAAS